MKRSKRHEDTDIDHYLQPKFDIIGIPYANTRRNISTDLSGRLRGDLWISTVQHDDTKFEENIIALIECKSHRTSINDSDWLDAKRQGKLKAKKQGLKSFFVTNTDTRTRCYNVHDSSEIILDGKIIAELQPISILRAIETQVHKGNSEVLYSTFAALAPNHRQFRTSLWNLRQLFRGCGVSKGSESIMIQTTLTLCILKLISEQQKRSRTIPETILLWDDWRMGRINKEIQGTINELTALPKYSHLKGALGISTALNTKTLKSMYREIGQYSLYDTDFDFFGLIYESFANAQIKRDFGEFYTPRHIIRTMVKLLLANEKKPRTLMICDPACGTGGFLVESLLFLKRQYKIDDVLTDETWEQLKKSTFFGYDSNNDIAIRFARVNMIMAGNSGTNIEYTEDSLIHLSKDKYDYILANVPYGNYAGNADISNFSYTNRKRYELLFIEKIVKALKLGGSAAVIVPDGLVETSDYEKFRMNFLYDVRLNAVVSLPDFAFEPYTTEKTYILFFTRKRPSECGRFQEETIWHFIVDNDGFQAGKKRYQIVGDELPMLEGDFMKMIEPEKAGFVSINDVNKDTFYSFASEAYFRIPKISELSIKEYHLMLEYAGNLVDRKKLEE